MADSDGDGATNGQELGDSDCRWTTDNAHAHLDIVKGHPGVYLCSPFSMSQNLFSLTRKETSTDTPQAHVDKVKWHPGVYLCSPSPCPQVLSPLHIQKQAQTRLTPTWTR